MPRLQPSAGEREKMSVATRLLRLGITNRERDALVEAVPLYHLNRMSVADGSEYRGGVKIIQPSGVPTPDQLIEEAVGGYSTNTQITRYHGLVGLCFSLATETEPICRSPAFMRPAKRYIKAYEDEVGPWREEYQAVVVAQKAEIEKLQADLKVLRDAMKAFVKQKPKPGKKKVQALRDEQTPERLVLEAALREARKEIDTARRAYLRLQSVPKAEYDGKIVKLAHKVIGPPTKELLG